MKTQDTWALIGKDGAFIEFDPIYFVAMLHQLSIKNYATVDTLEIEFKPGMSVITGETGAGKSIIMGALGLTLGDRADKTIVRSGASKADICAEFDTTHIAAATQWLSENDLTADDGSAVCILRRVVNSEGRSKGYINGSPVTMANLKSLGEMLIDIHSQHEHQSLLLRGTQQRLLDEYCVNPKNLAKMRDNWKQWQQNFHHIQQLASQTEEYSAQSQLLSYQLSELEEMAVGENEVQSLEAEYKSLNHADEIIASMQTAMTLCAGNDEQAITSMLHQALTVLQELPEKESRISNIIDLLETANIQLDEAVTQLRAFSEEFDADPQRLEQVNARLSQLHGIARKHKVNPSELLQVTARLRQQLDEFQHCDGRLEKLQADDRKLRSQHAQIALEVSGQRRGGANKLAKQVNHQLKHLGMPHASFEVTLKATEPDNPSLQGLESVEFLVSTNPGQPAKPLIKIASGGELSRISLAIQVITAQTSHIPSLVFDEVDVGIGGGVAKIVGELLRKLGDKTQILCVTHQAQVAGKGHNHLFVSKYIKGNSTLTQIEELADDAKIKEVARMLGGEEFSDESLAHAQQMVANS